MPRFPNEVVVTSADVGNGKIENIGMAGESYRLYAVAEIYSEEPLVKQVTITDSKGKTFKLNDLFGKAGAYFLSEDNIVTGPLTVADPTPSQATRRTKRSVAYRLTYTIYLVSAKVPSLPVADVTTSYPRMRVKTENGKESKGITIISAQNRFTLRMFAFSAESAYVIPRGYDVSSSGAKDSVLDLTKDNADASYITIFGPIVTVLNKDQSKTGIFNIALDPISYEVKLDAGSSLSLLSPNWLSFDESYSTTFTKYSEAFDRTFDYDQETDLDFTISTSALKTGESIAVEIHSEKETKTFTYGPADKGEIARSATGNSLRLKVNVAALDNPAAYPRFIVKANSAAKDTAPKSTTTMKSTTSGAQGATVNICCLLLAVIVTFNGF